MLEHNDVFIPRSAVATSPMQGGMYGCQASISPIHNSQDQTREFGWFIQLVSIAWRSFRMARQIYFWPGYLHLVFACGCGPVCSGAGARSQKRDSQLIVLFGSMDRTSVRETNYSPPVTTAMEQIDGCDLY